MELQEEIDKSTIIADFNTPLSEWADPAGENESGCS